MLASAAANIATSACSIRCPHNSQSAAAADNVSANQPAGPPAADTQFNNVLEGDHDVAKRTAAGARNAPTRIAATRTCDMSNSGQRAERATNRFGELRLIARASSLSPIASVAIVRTFMRCPTILACQISATTPETMAFICATVIQAMASRTPPLRAMRTSTIIVATTLNSGPAANAKALDRSRIAKPMNMSATRTRGTPYETSNPTRRNQLAWSAPTSG